ncbi:salivary glue protein Sgs-3-like isoform X2 [Oscarella lobularis]|uniref:salivary glue protein Sgs-3-like isoform X2 n=1 Tax=Oscarella lobularis TaxID=121494 RepID=UPI003313E01C
MRIFVVFLIAYASAQTTPAPTANNTPTATATATATATSMATTQSSTTQPAPTTQPRPTQPSYEKGTYKLLDVDNNNAVCAELTLAAKFDINYMTDENEIATAQVVLPPPDNVNVTGECADLDSDTLSSTISISWTDFTLAMIFAGEIPPPTTPAPTTAPTTRAPTTQAATTQASTTQAATTQAATTQAPTTQAATTRAPTTQAATTQAPTTQAATTQAPTTQAPSSSSSRRRLLALREGENGLVNIGFMYNTANPVFVNPQNVTVVIVVYNVTENDDFSFGEGKQYKCNSQRSLALKEGDDKVTMDIKDALLSPFQPENSDDGVTPCQADKDKVVIPIAVGCTLAALLLITVIAFVIGRSRSRGGYQTI